MIFSPYQTDIFDFVSKGTKSGFVEAVAGSGKTTTIVKASELMEGSVIFLAFNKHIATTLSERMPDYVQVRTLNAFGNSIVRNNWRGSRLDAQKTKYIWEATLSGKKALTFKVTRVISLFKAIGIHDPVPQDVVSVLDNYSIDYKEQDLPAIIDAIITTFKRSLQMQGFYDFDDQVFLPIHFNWPMPQFDWVCVDEAQDLNPIQQDMIAKIIKGRLLAVGDTNQAIYGFRGADPYAVATMKKTFNCEELPLSISYRCGKNIVKEAQKIVKHIQYSDTSIDGEVIETKEFKPEYGDFVLCRCTAPLVSECLKLIQSGVSACVLGRDIGIGLKELIDNLSSDRPDLDTMLNRLYDYEMEKRQRFFAMDKPDLVLLLEDKCETIRALSVNAKTVEEILSRIDTMFQTDQKGVTFSTVHKSKGLEAKNVWILKPELMPHPKATNEWQKVQENNLKYVAITRAQEKLIYVRDK